MAVSEFCKERIRQKFEKHRFKPGMSDLRLTAYLNFLVIFSNQYGDQTMFRKLALIFREHCIFEIKIVKS